MKKIKLGSKVMNEDSLYFIADIGANHDGSLDKAKKLIKLAKDSGADAAKFQNFQASKIVSAEGFKGLKISHQSKWKKSVFEVYKDASIPVNWTETLKEECDKVNIDYFTSPYDFDSVDLVDPYVDLYKIGSGDISWIEIIEYILSKGKPTLIATGASSLDDVKRVMHLTKKYQNDIVLMQCNTNYSGSDENFNYCNLNVLNQYKNLFPNTVLGLSDHTSGHSTTLGAISLGARVIEKHFTDDNNQIGPDHGFAMNPVTWKDMVDRSYELLSALGDGKKRIEDNEKDSFMVQRRSIRFSEDLKEGHEIKKENLVCLRPITKDGLNPYEINDYIGKKLTINVSKGDQLTKKIIK